MFGRFVSLSFLWLCFGVGGLLDVEIGEVFVFFDEMNVCDGLILVKVLKLVGL